MFVEFAKKLRCRTRSPPRLRILGSLTSTVIWGDPFFLYNRLLDDARVITIKKRRKRQDRNSLHPIFAKPWENAIVLRRNLTNPEDWRIVFKGNGSIITDQRGVAETLSNFFTSLGQTQQSGSGAKLNPYLSHVQHWKPLLFLRKTNKAMGSDRIPQKAVEKSAEILEATLTFHFHDWSPNFWGLIT